MAPVSSMFLSLHTDGRLARWLRSPGCQLALCVLLPAVIALAFYEVKSRNFRATTLTAAPVSSVEGIRWVIDTLRFDPATKRYVIDGWAAQTRRDASWLKTRVVLAPADQSQGLEIKTNLVPRKDVSAAFADGRENHYSGFRAQVKAKYLVPLAGARVLLSVEQDGRKSLIDTGRTLAQLQP